LLFITNSILLHLDYGYYNRDISKAIFSEVEDFKYTIFLAQKNKKLYTVGERFIMIQYLCDRCGREIPQTQTRFSLKMELFASKENLYFSESDLQKDLRAEMEQLIRQMEQMDLDQLNDEVYVKYEFDVCNACRKELYFQFRRRLPLDFPKMESYN
jgi:hypothetical protein